MTKKSIFKSNTTSVITPESSAIAFVGSLLKKNINNTEQIATAIIKAHENGTNHFTDEFVVGAQKTLENAHSLSTKLASASLKTGDITYQDTNTTPKAQTNLPNALESNKPLIS